MPAFLGGGISGPSVCGLCAVAVWSCLREDWRNAPKDEKSREHCGHLLAGGGAAEAKRKMDESADVPGRDNDMLASDIKLMYVCWC